MMTPATAPAPAPLDNNAARAKRSMLIYRICFAYNALLTAVWLLLVAGVISGGSLFLVYKLTLQQIIGTVIFFVVFWATWSYGWYFIKRAMLRRFGLDNAEMAEVFGTRLEGFDLSKILAHHSERKLRIIDMIARRGRTLVFIGLSFGYVYVQTQKTKGPEGLAFGLQANVFDAIVMNAVTLLAFTNAGWFGNMIYGAQARVLDGVQGRANALCIGTLWSAFRFVMIPLGAVLAKMYAPNRYAVLFAFIWVSYAVADYATEIFGSLWGRHNIRVWGLGDINRKSWEGAAAGFVCCAIFLVGLAWSQRLEPGWYVLAMLLSVVNPIVELVSPRGSDDFTMATVNALICVAAGRFL